METSVILTIIAIILGPIFAVQIDKYLTRSRENVNRKLNIFKTLMATRGSALSFTHVEALNRIDLEFTGDKKFQKVIEAWKEYFDNLGKKFGSNEEFTVWSAKNEELLANLLYEMGHSLGYKFDKVLIKRNIYSPVGHARIERENELIREGLLKVLHGESSFPVSLENVNINEDYLRKQAVAQEIMIQYYQKMIEKE